MDLRLWAYRLYLGSWGAFAMKMPAHPFIAVAVDLPCTIGPSAAAFKDLAGVGA